MTIQDCSGAFAGIESLSLGAHERRSGFYSLFNNAPHGMLLVGADGKIVAANQRTAKMFGYETAELKGLLIEALLPTRFREEHVGKRQGYIAEPSERAMGRGRDLTGLRKDGIEFPLEIGLSQITTSQGSMTCATIINITERKRSELRLREANAQLEEFTSVASHDLRSPLRGIAHLIDFIRDDFSAGNFDSGLYNLERIEKRSVAMEGLIEDLLVYARAGQRTVELQPVLLNKIVAEVIALEQVPDGFTIALDLPEDSFLGATTPLSTIIRNLISNALKHHDREQGQIEVTGRFIGSYCIIDIRDDGPGIPRKARERVFRLFQTLTRSRRGNSGLGLAVAQRLAIGHGGDITLLDNHDDTRGTCFRISWPLYSRTDLND